MPSVSQSFLWYDVRAKIKRWWHDCSGREAPLTMGADVVKWVKQENGTTLLEDRDLSEKLEGVGLE